MKLNLYGINDENIKNKESEKMLELEENIRLLEELKSKLQNLGESL